ncbi:Domain of unknown function DUF3635 [Ostreococcus tauri]|uniref:non-specific serine/threonine protein kinase n=1 Tax=Ostreococcus tauri TaxID=70448 RepID=A0A090M7K0_OSTTA|nr:Domain of unknown function DUF3635 [Ostreococcus tauri]CEF98084.1 Domain of unknown function DUF3635 [Ostreococcus tauri]|eukprot:XP_022839069.1 Domain of unknown function DUF3635 [Ostreococcus tauri]
MAPEALRDDTNGLVTVERYRRRGKTRTEEESTVRGTKTTTTTTTTTTTIEATARDGGAVKTNAEGRDGGSAAAATRAATERARTFVFKSRNKLTRCARAEREHRARLAKLAESRAFFDDVDEVSLAEESEGSTPNGRGGALGNRLELSPSGLIEALQGLGLVNDASGLRAKMAATTRRDSMIQSPRAQMLPIGRADAFDRTSDWVSSLPAFSPMKERVESTTLSSPEENESIIATDDEVDSLQGDFERLVIDDECSPLAALLRACGQSEGDVSSMASLVRTHVKRGVKKIGEGTYGEAYRGEDGVVMKIVPMGGEALVNGEVQMGPNEIRSETSILKALTKLREHVKDEIEKNFTDGFIRLIDASVCRGPYSKKLLEAWDKYAVTGETENETPGNLPSNQLYISFACEDGGIDLEHFNLRSAKEMVALLFQIVVALSVAEEECQFEHRDLHWGNVLIKRVRTKEKVARINGVDINIQTSGLDVAIIDFTLSRLTTGEGDVFCDLNADPELFTGPKGHCQSETYRRMKRVTKGKWSTYNPKTNALWIHYLTDVILEQKDFPISVEEKHELVAFRKRALEYESAGKALFDDLFKGIWTSGKKKQ